MALDAGTVGTYVTGGGVILTAGFAYLSARISKKDRDERAADRREKNATADKLEAEKNEITQRASGLALSSVQSELTRVTTNLEKSYVDSERLRSQLAAKNEQIDENDRTIRALTRKAENLQEQNEEQGLTIRRLIRRSETLEEWIENNCQRFEELGINTLPRDEMGDRSHHDVPDQEEGERGDRETVDL
jgi:chromosome segregation ATPase